MGTKGWDGMSGGRLLLFGGTTEAREILARGVPALCCVATEYGAALAEEGIAAKGGVRAGVNASPPLERSGTRSWTCSARPSSATSPRGF